MPLFDQIMGAIANPNQQANPDQLTGILNTVQGLSQRQGIDPSLSQTVLSLVGNHVRSALQQKQAQEGRGQAEAIVNQYSGTNPNMDAVSSLFSPGQQQQVTHDVAQQTGLPAELIQSMLPALIPVILNFLRSGATQQNSQNSNTVLNAFLDSDQDGDVDIGDAMAVAGRFFNQPR